MENSVTVSAGGMDISIIGCNIRITVGSMTYVTTVGKLEGMINSHQYLIDASKQFINAWEVIDPMEVQNAINSTREALRRAE